MYVTRKLFAQCSKSLQDNNAVGGTAVHEILAQLLIHAQAGDISADPSPKQRDQIDASKLVQRSLARLCSDHYATLGLRGGAAVTAKDVKKQYRLLVLRYHPDKCKHTASIFRAVHEAYQILGDPARRQRYDKTCSRARARAEKPTRPSPPRKPSPPTPAPPQSRPQAKSPPPRRPPPFQPRGRTKPRSASTTSAGADGDDGWFSAGAGFRFRRKSKSTGPGRSGAAGSGPSSDDSDSGRDGAVTSDSDSDSYCGENFAAIAAAAAAVPPRLMHVVMSETTADSLTLRWSEPRRVGSGLRPLPDRVLRQLRFELQWRLRLGDRATRAAVSMAWRTAGQLLAGAACRKRNLAPDTEYEFRLRTCLGPEGGSRSSGSAWCAPAVGRTLPAASRMDDSFSAAAGVDIGSTAVPPHAAPKSPSRAKRSHVHFSGPTAAAAAARAAAAAKKARESAAKVAARAREHQEYMREKSKDSARHASSSVPSRGANSWRRRKSKGAALHWRCSACGSLNKTEPLSSAHTKCRVCGEHRFARQGSEYEYEGYGDRSSSGTSECDSGSDSEQYDQQTWDSADAATAAAREAREAANAARRRANAARQESAAQRCAADHEAEMAREQRAQAWRMRSEANAEAEAKAAQEAAAKAKAEQDWEARARDWRQHAEASHAESRYQAEPAGNCDADIDTDTPAHNYSDAYADADAGTGIAADDVDEVDMQGGTHGDSANEYSGQQAYTWNNAAEVDDDPTQWEGWEQWTNGTLPKEQAEAWASQWTDGDEREWAEWEHSARACGWSAVDISAARRAASGAPPDAPDAQPTGSDGAASSASATDPAAPPTVASGKEAHESDGLELGGGEGQQEVWYEQGDEAGNLYYSNSLTGESKWESDLEWVDYTTAEGDVYYLHIPTGVSQWDMPQAFVPIVREEQHRESQYQGGHVAANADGNESKQEEKGQEEEGQEEKDEIDDRPLWKGQRASG